MAIVSLSTFSISGTKTSLATFEISAALGTNVSIAGPDDNGKYTATYTASRPVGDLVPYLADEQGVYLDGTEFDSYTASSATEWTFTPPKDGVYTFVLILSPGEVEAEISVLATAQVEEQLSVIAETGQQRADWDSFRDLHGRLALAEGAYAVGTEGTAHRILQAALEDCCKDALTPDAPDEEDFIVLAPLATGLALFADLGSALFADGGLSAFADQI